MRRSGRWGDRVRQRVAPSGQPRFGGMFLLALLVGLMGGGATLAFEKLLLSTLRFIFGPSYSLAPLPSPVLLLAPAVGGLLAGLLVHFVAPDAKGGEVPDMMEDIEKRGGRMPPKVTAVEVASAYAVIGLGGSAGRLGPIMQFSGLLASLVGGWLRVGERPARMLVACAATAGFASSFRAPVAGVLFPIEVLLWQADPAIIILLAASAACSNALTHAVYGNAPLGGVVQYQMVDLWELLLFAALGAIAALVAQAFRLWFTRAKAAFEAWSLVRPVKFALGGLAVGTLALAYPQVLDTGIPVIQDMLRGHLGPEVTAPLLFIKILAVTATLAVGSPGGILTPMVFMGAALGGSYGFLVNAVLPATTSPPGAYALVGVAAVLAAAIRAPLTGVVTAIEFSDDYPMVLPLITAVVVATGLSQYLGWDSLYLAQMRLRNEEYHAPDISTG